MEWGNEHVDYRSLLVAAAVAAVMAFYQAKTQPLPTQTAAEAAGLAER